MTNLTKLLGGDNAGRAWIKLYRRQNGAWVAELEQDDTPRSVLGAGISIESALTDLENATYDDVAVIEDYAE